MKPVVADVTVVIPTYNAAHLLPRAIASVLAQTLAVKEIVVVDDGSTDGTELLMNKYASPVSYIRQANAGASAARNAGIRSASTKWIGLLDADDFWTETKIELQLEAAREHPEAAVIYCDATVLSSDGKIAGTFLTDKGAVSGWVFERFLESFFVLPSTALVRREALEAVGLFTESMRIVEDYDLWLRMSRKYEFWLVPKPLIFYERQDHSATKDIIRMAEGELVVLDKLLATHLTSAQKKKVKRRISKNLFNLAYELRTQSPHACVRPAWENAKLNPASLRTWKLLLGNLGRSLSAGAR